MAGLSRWLLIMFLFMGVQRSVAQVNRALIIAIDDYPPEGSWRRIHAVNDVDLVVPMLQGAGYLKKDIRTLTNKQATKWAIVTAFRELTTVAGEGDYIYIHFSGHGQQMVDDNGDEPDGLDEAFIPYDAQRRYRKNVYEGENHLRDDELGNLLDNIRNSVGPDGNVCIVLDACHSATGTRYRKRGYVRGTSYIFAPPGYKVPLVDPDKFVLSLRKDSRLAPLHVWNACKADESNYEYESETDGTYYGVLTYAFHSLIKENRLYDDYSLFFRALKHKVASLQADMDYKQTPGFESTDESKAFKISR